jgi:predicted regulator of Ras-like GTPase activity (Roadblock/LC7/MglB family)
VQTTIKTPFMLFMLEMLRDVERKHLSFTQLSEKKHQQQAIKHHFLDFTSRYTHQLGLGAAAIINTQGEVVAGLNRMGHLKLDIVGLLVQHIQGESDRLTQTSDLKRFLGIQLDMENGTILARPVRLEGEIYFFMAIAKPGVDLAEIRMRVADAISTMETSTAAVDKPLPGWFANWRAWWHRRGKKS